MVQNTIITALLILFIWRCDILLDHGIFNVALQTLLDKDRKKYPQLKVPLIFQEVCLTALFTMMHWLYSDWLLLCGRNYSWLFVFFVLNCIYISIPDSDAAYVYFLKQLCYIHTFDFCLTSPFIWGYSSLCPQGRTFWHCCSRFSQSRCSSCCPASSIKALMDNKQHF